MSTVIIGEDGRARLDLTDGAVRAMAARNHVPAERWTMDGKQALVGCEECGQEWPCATREALRRYPEYGS